MKNNIVVSGANGFIGNTLIKKLLEDENNYIYGIYRKTPKEILNHNRLIQISNLDLSENNFNKLNNIQIDYFFHCASNSNYLEKSKDLIYKDNILATKNICSFLEKKKINLFIYLSTIGVHDRKFLSSSNKKLSESSDLSAKSIYGKSKISSEHLINESKINHLIIRPSWIYGEKMSTKSHIRQLYNWCKEQKFFTKLSFTGRVTVCEVNSFVETLIYLAFKKDRKYKKYIIGDINPLAFSDLFKIYHKNLKYRKLIKIFSIFSFLFPSKLRILLEDYLVCDLKQLKDENIEINNDNIEIINSYLNKKLW